MACSPGRHLKMDPRQDLLLFYFFSCSVRRPNHCYYERSPVRTRAFFLLPSSPLHPSVLLFSPRGPLIHAIDFGQANYIFSLAVEGIKL